MRNDIFHAIDALRKSGSAYAVATVAETWATQTCAAAAITPAAVMTWNLVCTWKTVSYSNCAFARAVVPSAWRRHHC